MAQKIHEELCSLARKQATLDYELCDWLRAAYQHGVHRAFGFGSLREYAERTLGWSGRQTEERLRVAFALEHLPRLKNAAWRGEIGWCVVRELTRVATEQTESDWMAAARGKTAREVEELVSGREVGDRPSDARSPEAQMHRLTLRVGGPTWGLWLEAKEKLTKQLGAHADDETVLAAMARAVLGGSDDEGRSNYQAVMSVCSECGTVAQQAGPEVVVLDAVSAETALCDAQHVHEHERASQTIPPRIRRKVLARHHGRCAVPGCRQSAFVDVHHVDLRSEGGTHNEDRLVPLCGAHHQHVHEGRLLVKGRYSSGLVFEHADGTTYGHEASWERCTELIEAHAALRKQGMQFSEIEALLDRSR